MGRVKVWEKFGEVPIEGGVFRALVKCGMVMWTKGCVRVEGR